MRPQEVQMVKWSQLINDGEFKVFEINDSWSEKNHAPNHHLKGRAKGFSRKTLPLSGETLNILNVFRKKQSEFLKGTDQINKNDYILLNLRDSRLTFLGMPIGQASKWANTSGIALSFLAFRLGHSVQQLLKTYVHEDADRSQNMMNLMKKDNDKKIINLKGA